ncbi:DNA recombination protein RmuC [Oceanivirga salmonicida]|uniref:DNA recombination protein RmuC n=1 Tax=Oceanivirga salmonicida TaxID=1769291 RepID=UPI0012E1569D|nr:DNA recombination protein RmuC [Oceanivirga salmonicida]
MDILYVLLVILIILVCYLIFLMKNKDNRDFKHEIIEKMIEKNNDTKEDITRLMYENKNNISKDIIDFKDNLKNSVEKNIFDLIDKVDKKLVENNEISNNSTKSMLVFKDTLKEGIDKNIDELISKIDVKLEGNTKSITDFKFDIKDGIYKNIDELTKKVEEKLKSSNMLDKDIKDGIVTFKESVKENIAKDLLELGTKVENILKSGFKTSTDTFNSVLERLAKMDEAQKNILKLSNDIMGLQAILTDKKSRGNFGETRLEQVLNYVYGSSGLYSMQYKLSNGKIADSVVYIDDKLTKVCIDSKFPLENYLKYMENTESRKNFIIDVKNHIDAISSKYIIEGETLNTAIMFLPSEAIFMEIYSNFEEILNYAYDKKVWVASQTNLMIYIATMQLATLNYKKNKSAEQILTQLNDFSIEFNRYEERWNKLQNDFSKLEKDFSDVRITTDKINKKFDTIKRMVETEQINEKEL